MTKHSVFILSVPLSPFSPLSMRGSIFTFLLLIPLLTPHAFSQTLPHAPTDSSAINLLLKNATALTYSHPQKSLLLTLDAFHQSQLIHFNKGLAQSLNQTGLIYQLESKYDLSIQNYQKAWRIARSFGLYPEEATSLQGIGESFMRLHLGDSAMFYLQLAFQNAKNKNDVGIQAGVYNNIGNVYLNENKLEDALGYFIQAAERYDSLKDSIGLSKALSNLGNVEYKLNHLDKAIRYAEQSKYLAELNDYLAGIGYAHKLLGWIHRKQGNIPTALVNYDSAIVIYANLNMKRDVAEITINVGNAHYDLGNFNKAISFYSKSLQASRKAAYNPFIPYAFSGLANSHYSLTHYPLALSYADSLAQFSKTINAYLLMDAYELKSLILEKQGEFKQALGYKEQFINLKDSLTDRENRNAMEEAEAKFQNNYKQKEIDQLKLMQSLRESRLQLIQLIIGIGLILIVVIVWLIVNRLKLIERTNKQLEIERMRNSIARDLHDDIGSALSSINMASQLALNITQPNSTQLNFQRITEQASRAMESMSDIVWSINPDNDSLEKVLIKMREFAVEILESKNIQFQFNPTHTPLFHIDSDQRKNLFLFFKEAINNAAKHSKCTFIDIELSVSDQILKLKIADNGIGFSTACDSKGNGLKNMKTRADLLNATLEIDSQTLKGTTLVLTVALT